MVYTDIKLCYMLTSSMVYTDIKRVLSALGLLVGYLKRFRTYFSKASHAGEIWRVMKTKFGFSQANRPRAGVHKSRGHGRCDDESLYSGT
jgi:hypothetical protein